MKAKEENKKTILKVLTGSRAHGLHMPSSDYDYRAVYILPTTKILSIGYKYKGTDWVEDVCGVDNTAYELGHFLMLATKCNPTILEIFKAPIEEITEEGKELRELFPYVWNAQDAFNAYAGYGLNQRKKFLDNKDNRRDKYAVAYCRTLYQLQELLLIEDFSVEVKDKSFATMLALWKRGAYKIGSVIEYAMAQTLQCEESLKHCKHKADINKVNEFLIKMRKRFWTEEELQ